MARRTGGERDSRAALLAAAWELLLEQGAGAASVDAIVARARLSKGTFFHFFPTKMALFEELCGQVAAASWRKVGSVLENRRQKPLRRLDAWLRVSRSWRLERPLGISGLWSEATREENAMVLKKIQALSTEFLIPALTAVIVDGVAAGQLRVSEPEMAARFVIDLGMGAASENLRLLSGTPGAASIDIVVRRANATIEAIERVLGAPEGALHRLRRQELAGLAQALAATDAHTVGMDGARKSTRQNGRPAGRRRRARGGRR